MPGQVFAYLASDDAKLAWITALLCAVFAFAILSLPRGIMDFDIEAGLEGTAESMTALLKTLKLNVTLAPSANVFKVLASLFSALIGMLTVLPAFRFSRAYYDLTTKHVASPGVQYVSQRRLHSRSGASPPRVAGLCSTSVSWARWLAH